MNPKLSLTETNNVRTIDAEDQNMEPGLKKLLDRKEVLQRQKIAVSQELDAIEKALDIMGFAADNAGGYRDLEEQYAKEKPFKGKRLTEACLALMEDCGSVGLWGHPLWIDKSEVEHLLQIGGFQFGKGNPTNSVEITLRRLAAQGKCAVRKRGGPHSSKYSAKAAMSKESDDSEHEANDTKDA